VATSSRDLSGTERRIAPRIDEFVNLTYWLEICRRSEGLQALALSDDRGSLIAGAGVSRICDELAALAPSAQVLVPAAESANSLAIGRGRAYLCAPAGLLKQKTLAEFGIGCSRILGL